MFCWKKSLMLTKAALDQNIVKTEMLLQITKVNNCFFLFQYHLNIISVMAKMNIQQPLL